MALTSRDATHDVPRQVFSAALIEWTVVQEGLWVGKVNGEFAGMIETRPGEGFYAMTRVAGPLGSFSSLDEAKASFRA